MALQLGNSTINDIINEINNISSNEKIAITIDNMTANQDKEIIVDEEIPTEENKIAFISFSNDTNAIALESGIVLKSVNPTEKKFIFKSDKDVDSQVKIIVTFI